MASDNYSSLLERLTAIRDENRVHANTANRIGTALIELLGYLNDAPYLRKDQPDTTNYLLTLLAGAIVGESGQIRLNPDGSISCSRLTVEGSAIFDELVFNHQNVLEGDTYFSDRGTIENVTFLGANQYRLLMRKEHDNDVLTFHESDILRCAMNNLDTNHTYKTSWMRVNSVDTTANTMDVTLYDGEDVPGGVNYEPEAGANVVRWGNQVDTSRQQVFFVSSEDGRIVYYINQTAPIVGDENYGFVIGRLPSIKPVRDSGLVGEVGIYTKNILFERSMVVNWMGEVKYITIDMGEWNETKAANGTYFFTKELENNKTVCTRVQVTHNGQVWQTQASQTTTILTEPTLSDSNWVYVSGKLNDVFYYTTSETDNLDEGGVGLGSDVPLWRTDQSFFFLDKVDGVDNPYQYNEFRPYMWRKSHRQVGDNAADYIVVEEPHIIGVFGQTGTNYIINVPIETVSIDTNASSATFEGDIFFYTDNGGIRNEFFCYTQIWILHKDKTRTQWSRQPSVKVAGWSSVEITVTEDDAAIEIYGNSSGHDMLTTYLFRKEIKVIKAAKGDMGPRGYAGPVSRMFQDELIYGMTYYEGTATVVGEPNIHYQDYIAIPCSNSQSGYLVFRCVDNNGYTFPATSQHPVGGKFKISGTYKTALDIRGFMMNLNGGLSWEEVDVNAASAFFTNLIAQNAFIRMLTGSNFVITDDLGKVLAGMGNMTDAQGNQYYLWSGGQDADHATFKVYADGTIDAMKGNFSGFLTKKETMITSQNVLDYVEDGINPHNGERTYVFDMDKIGSTLSFYQPLNPDDAKFDDGTTFMYPQGYNDIAFPLDETNIGSFLYINLPYDIGGVTSYYRTTFLARFGVGNTQNGLGLYRYFLTKDAANKVVPSVAVTKTESDIPSSSSDEWYLYPYKYVGALGAYARQLIGNKIVIRLYGSIFNGLKFSGIYFETTHSDYSNGYQQKTYTLYDVYTFDQLKAILYGQNGSTYADANVLTLECKLIDDIHIGWVPSFSFHGYYDRFTLGLPDLNS